VSDFEATVEKIMATGKLSRDELMARIRAKREELYGFVTLEGAAGMVGEELGVRADG